MTETLCHGIIVSKLILEQLEPYSEIDDVNLKCTLSIFKQWLALKMWVDYVISVILPLTCSHKAFSGYIPNRKLLPQR